VTRRTLDPGTDHGRPEPAGARTFDREADRTALNALRTAVRADFGSSVMIYALPDLARGIARSLAMRGLHATVAAPDPDRLVVADADAAALAAIARAVETTRFG
jgi:hypothetical protein